MIVLDTTVLVYAFGVEHPLREPCRRLRSAIRRHEIEATTTTEVIQEFASIRARRRPRADAVRLARDFAQVLSPLLTTGAEDLDLGLRLFERHQRLGAFDLVLAAVAIRREAEALVSADRGFAGIRGLRHVAPGTRAFDRLLER